MKEYRANNKERLLERQREKRKSAPLVSLWKQVSARRHRLNITREEFMAIRIPDSCPVLGIPITYELSRDNIPSVDRIDPNRPYEVGNIAIISYRANMIKSIGAADEHKRVADWMERNGNPPAKKIGGKPLEVGQTYLKYGRGREKL